MIWDDKKHEVLFNFDMNEPIHSLAFTNEMFTVAKQDTLVCCSLFNGVVNTIDTGINPRGI